MKEFDYILIQRLINLRNAYSILTNNFIGEKSGLQDIVRLLTFEIEWIQSMVGDLEVDVVDRRLEGAGYGVAPSLSSDMGVADLETEEQNKCLE